MYPSFNSVSQLGTNLLFEYLQLLINLEIFELLVVIEIDQLSLIFGLYWTIVTYMLVFGC